MSSTTRQSHVYRPSLWTRISEGLRSNYGVGQWSWLAHRITGLGVLLFLVIHVVDTFFVVAYPGLYDHTVSLYSGRVPWILDATGQPTYYWPIRWLFRLSELGLIACVVFHSFNGVRVVLVDLWPGAVAHQKQLFRWVLGSFMVVMIIVSIFVFKPLLEDPREKFWKMPEESSNASTAGDRF